MVLVRHRSREVAFLFGLETVSSGETDYCLWNEMGPPYKGGQHLHLRSRTAEVRGRPRIMCGLTAALRGGRYIGL
ncbi:hypothetical protein NPIL_139471, partial [Nephila pilipes]